MARLAKPLDQRLEVRNLLALPIDPRARDALQTERHLEDVSGEPHPAQSRAEQIRLRLIGHLDDPPIREPHLERRHMLPEAPFDVVVLSVHIGGHHPTDGDELSSGSDGREPAPRKEVADELEEREPRLGPHEPGRLVEGNEPVCRRRIRDGSALACG